jgi:hypothetical protein
MKWALQSRPWTLVFPDIDVTAGALGGWHAFLPAVHAQVLLILLIIWHLSKKMFLLEIPDSIAANRQPPVFL